MNYSSFCQALAGQELPLAWLDLDALRANADAILQAADDIPVRIVSKSLRCVEVMRWLLDYHPGFRGILCFHASEAVFLSRQGFDDLVVAYPTMQAGPIAEVCEETAVGKRIVLMVDSPEHLRLIDRVAAAVGVIQPLCFDLDMSLELPGLYFGVRRSPLKSVPDVLALLDQMRQCSHIDLVGVMGYEAQIAGVGDRVPGKHLQNQVVPRLKRLSIQQLHQRRQAMVEALRKAGVTLSFVNGGGTGSILSTRKDKSVTEIAVGSGFYAPHLFDYYSDFQFQPAAGFALEVGRRANRHSVTCSGGGYVASGSAGPEKLPRPWLPEGLRLDTNEGAGEVQTPLIGEVAELSPGDSVIFRHAKAGELCERFNSLHVLRQGQWLKEWPTYRGQGLNFM